MVRVRTLGVCLLLAGVLVFGTSVAGEPDSSASAPSDTAVPAGGAARFNRPHTIAVERLFLPSSLETPEPIRIKFERFLVDQLRSAGFEVIPSERFEALRVAVADSMGGFFNAETGEVDSVRFAAVSKAVGAIAQERLAADAIVKAGIGLVSIPFRGGPKIRWDGGEDNIGASGYGTVSGYSFVVFVSGTDGSDVHFGSGGIQLAMKFRKKSFLDSNLVLKDVERKDLFTKEERNLRAVRMALTPFAANEKRKD